MSLDVNTVKLLQHQFERRQHWMSLVPPNRFEAESCMLMIDRILDRRPRPIAVEPDGTIMYDDASPWALGQLVPKVAPIARNETGKPEQILTTEQLERLIVQNSGIAPPREDGLTAVDPPGLD